MVHDWIVTSVEFDGDIGETELRKITEIATSRVWTPSEDYSDMEDDLDLVYDDIANQISDETGWCVSDLEICLAAGLKYRGFTTDLD